MAEKTRLMHILIDQNIYDAVIADINRLNLSKRSKATSIAAWVRQAIAARLREAAKAKPKRSLRNFECAQCGIEQPKRFLAVTEELLTGETLSYCSRCRPGRETR